jgi:DNA-binding NarL/FixJ family response regulator
MSQIRIVLAEDHALVRAGIRALLEKIPGVEILAEVNDGLEAIKTANTTHPDLVLMDIAMKGLNGLEATARIIKEGLGTRVIILSMYATEEYFQQALQAGASGYLLKDADRGELELAIKTVSRGEQYLTPAVAKYAMDAYLQRTEGEISPLAKLSPRQREILQLVSEGKTTKDIAQRLNLSVRTVESHRADIMDRLDIHDVPGLVRFAIQTGLIEPSP